MIQTIWETSRAVGKFWNESTCLAKIDSNNSSCEHFGPCVTSDTVDTLLHAESDMLKLSTWHVADDMLDMDNFEHGVTGCNLMMLLDYRQAQFILPTHTRNLMFNCVQVLHFIHVTSFGGCRFLIHFRSRRSQVSEGILGLKRQNT